MKTFFMLMFLFIAVTTGQTNDTLKFVSTDSIDVHALVQKQIEDAQSKKTEEVVNASLSVEPKVAPVPVVKEEYVKSSTNSILDFFIMQPFQYLIYEVASILIVGFVLIRRLLKNHGRSSKKNLKIKIGMMREEKIGGTKTNVKMMKIRRVLKDNLEIFKQNDKQLAKTARQLDVSQGELLLAARLKFFEMKKM